MAEKTYVVTAACAMVKVGDRFRTVQQGGAVPAGADPDHVKLLIKRGMVEAGDPPGGIDSDPNAKPPFVAPAGASSEPVVEGYESKTAPELEAEIASRNEGRADDAKIVVGGKGNKPDLIEALEADDAAQAV